MANLTYTVNPDTGCWLTNRAGYVVMTRGGRTVFAHRWLYEQIVGPIPVGLELDHLCRVPPCVNPAHLEPVTHRENTLRGEGPTAINAAKTHCIHGHEFTPENTYYRPDDPRQRQCKECKRIRLHAWCAARKAS